MKRILLAIILFTGLGSVKAQILTPVKFSYSAKKVKPNEYEIHVKAAIDDKWHIYSVYNPEGGADPTTLSISGGEKVGNVKEVGKLKSYYDKNFKANQKYFESTVDFVQVVKVKPGATKIQGSIEYTACNDSRCIPPKEVPFEIKL